MPLTSGATFGGYSVLRLLGCGETGDVYLVQHPRLPQWNALKVLSARLTEDREFHDRFMRETPIATTLYHPHILGVEYRGETDGQLWVTMDYVNGASAAQLIANRLRTGMPVGEVLATITAAADALDYAHSRGMLHRNMTPANILFTSPTDGERQILLTDFGIARPLGDPNGLAAPGLTGEAVAYTAPEQLAGSDIDGRADQYALAATAFHLLTGAPPFQQSNPAAVVSQHPTARPPGLRDRRPDLARLDDVLATALAKNPHDRFESCRAFADALSYSAGAWTGERSPEAYLTVVDYPDDMPEAAPTPGGPAQSGVFPAWARTVRGLAQHHSAIGQAAEAPAQPAVIRRRRWPWIVALSSAAAALCAGLLGVGIVIGRGNDAAPKQAPGPTTAIRSSAAAAAPPATTSRNFPGPGEALDGSYRVDVNRDQQTYNSTPDPQPPNVSTWWAFRTSCTPTTCVATGTMLDDNNHQTPSPAGSNMPLVMDFRDGAWQSRPDTVQFACLGPDGAPAKQTTTQAIRLARSNGSLHGTMTVTVDTDECGQAGATIEIPAVAAHVGEVPAGVQVPSAPPMAPPAPVTTRPTR
ncbi:serine/threonine-protein kinase [Candidatus Mycobacterium methanotrophicum]|uniref:non-specific serine/threonine protein kinase n=1 Tax=Candidatus Mycobacterium methanotrophicum TaxID=2943498 RepID=A0ABY4QJR2_9MYCO|nr:serine/threonine-protein kinase [Candidatus Mycobacterium methanotrophicum]UQX09925.1 serine/threonine protein kinase [Candidatus Mycobacterium methanotrophicum]